MKTYADLIRLPTHLETVPAVDQGLRIKRMSQRLWMVREGIKSWCQPQRKRSEAACGGFPGFACERWPDCEHEPVAFGRVEEGPSVAPKRIPVSLEDLPLG